MKRQILKKFVCFGNFFINFAVSINFLKKKMKTKILLVLAVVMSVLGVAEMKGQDTIWTKIFHGSSSARFTKDGTKVLYTFGSRDSMQLCTADSGNILWSYASTQNVGKFMSPDSLTFGTEKGKDSSCIFYIRRLSDGAVVKTLDTILFNNYPRPLPYTWTLGTATFSNDGRFLFLATSDHGYLPDQTTINYIYKIDLLTNQLINLRRDSSISQFEMKPNENVLICCNKNGIAFYNTDSLKEYKSYKDYNGTYKTSRSGRYITTLHDPGNIYTWDTQCDSIIRRNHLDSLELFSLNYTNNDSIILISALPKSVWQWRLIFYNVLSGIKIKEMLMHYSFNGSLLTPESFEISNNGSKLLVCGPEVLAMFPFTLNPITHKDVETPQSLLEIKPNPSLETVRIDFNLTDSAEAKLTLYNSNGEFVMEIANRYFDVGKNQVSFSSKQLTNGMYFIKITSAKLNQSSKLIILK